MVNTLNIIFVVLLAIVAVVGRASIQRPVQGGGAVGTGFGIASLVMFVLSLGVPIYGNYVTLLALMFVMIAAFARSIVWPIVLVSVSAVKLLMLSPTWMVFLLHYGGDYLLATVAFLAAPLIAMGMASRTEESAPGLRSQEPATPPIAPAKALPVQPVDDIAAWDAIQDKDHADSLQEYLLRHPTGRFAELARMKLERMGIAPLAPAERPQAPEPVQPQIVAASAPAVVEKITARDDDNKDVPAESIIGATTSPVGSDDLFAQMPLPKTTPARPKRSAAPVIFGALLLLALIAGGGYFMLNGGPGSALSKNAATAPLQSLPPAQQSAAASTVEPAAPPQAAALASEPAPAFAVEAYRPTEPVQVRGTGVRLRTEPLATDEAEVVGVAQDGSTLEIVGRATQPEWVWYQVKMADGRLAFIRSDLTSAPLTVISLAVAADGTVVWGRSTPVEGEGLLNRLRQWAVTVPQPPVVISVDAAAKYKDVADVRIKVQRSGMEFLTFRPSGLTLCTPVSPPPDAPPQPAPPPVSVGVAPDGVLSWNGQVVTRDQLEANLKAEAARAVRPKVHVEPDDGASYGSVDSIHLLVKQAGLESMALELPSVMPEFTFDHPPCLVEPGLRPTVDR